MTSYKNLLQQAVARYGEILEQTLTIEAVLDEFQAQNIEQLSRELGQQMEQAKALDQQIDACPHKGDDSESIKLFARRRQLMEQILSTNEKLKPRMQSLRAMQLSEMKKIKQGRQTTSGYAQHLGSKTGRIINSTN